MLNRRTFFKGILSVLVLAGSIPAVSWLRGKQGTLPNIILFIVDDLRYGMFSHANHPVLKTPNIDRLAHDGVAFRNAFVTTPICPTSRASILTGNYALKHGIYQFGKSLPTGTTTYLKLLKEHGYNIGYVGKWGVGKWPKGFFNYLSITDNRSYSEGLFWIKRKGKHVHLTDLTTEKVVHFLKKQDGKKPFALVVSYNAVHPPFTPSRRLLDLYANAEVPVYNKGDDERVPEMVKTSVNRRGYQEVAKSSTSYQKYIRKYFSLIKGIDESVGNILRILDEKKIYDKTGMIFTSDNGFMLGDHGLFGKAEMYDASLRVPMLVKPPASRTLDNPDAGRLVLNIDVPATLLSMAGIRHNSMDGSDMLNADNNRKGFYCEFIQNRPSLNNCEGYRDHQYKYMRYYKDDVSEERLFNLQADPDELFPLDLQQNVELLNIYRHLMHQEKVSLSTSL